VLLLEKDRLPLHKVCGEFVSSESLPLLDTLLAGLVPNPLAGKPVIASARVFLDRKVALFPVLPAARSIARFDLDAALVQGARRAGVHVEEAVAARNVTQDGGFAVHAAGAAWSAKAVVNATGRWSQLTQYPATGRAKWIGLKAHYAESEPPASVDLYFFPGGYCGVQPVGKDTVNVAAMVRADTARSMEEVFVANPALWRRSRGWQALFPPLTTSGLHFRAVQTEEHGMMLAGDAAGFIDPFAGNGISLALQSGALAAESLTCFLQGGRSLAESHQFYRESYFKRLFPVFRNSARLRRLLSEPAWIRLQFLKLMGVPSLARIIFQVTRIRSA
jgi:flavin-dependent dehydrogenase